MSYAAKERAVAAALALLSIWPIGHFFLVRALDLNPWNWFGWAMYTTPAKRLVAEVYGPDGRQLDPAKTTPEHGRRLLAAYKRYSDRYMELGAFTDADAFARACFEAYPGYATVTIRVYAVGVDRRTASVEKRAVEGSPYEYRRGDVLPVE
jgi:hypothetical protein